MSWLFKIFKCVTVTENRFLAVNQVEDEKEEELQSKSVSFE